MPYQFLPEWPGAVEPSLRMLDGDVQKVTVIDPTPDEFGFAFDFGPPSRTGRHVDPKHVPTALTFSARKGMKIPDVDLIHGGFFCVSERMKGLIEGLEPGVHQFLPMTYRWKDGSVAEERWLFVCGNRVRALNGKKTTLKKAKKPGKYMASRVGNIVFDSANIGDRQFWVCSDMLGDYTFMSDRAFNLFVDADVTGLKLSDEQYHSAA